jgi:hypothetical protein
MSPLSLCPCNERRREGKVGRKEERGHRRGRERYSRGFGVATASLLHRFSAPNAASGSTTAEGGKRSAVQRGIRRAVEYENPDTLIATLGKFPKHAKKRRRPATERSDARTRPRAGGKSHRRLTTSTTLHAPSSYTAVCCVKTHSTPPPLSLLSPLHRLSAAGSLLVEGVEHTQSHYLDG